MTRSETRRDREGGVGVWKSPATMLKQCGVTHHVWQTTQVVCAQMICFTDSAPLRLFGA